MAVRELKVLIYGGDKSMIMHIIPNGLSYPK